MATVPSSSGYTRVKIVFFIQLAPLLGYNKYYFVFIK